MPSDGLCKERILSEEYMDFIIAEGREIPIANADPNLLCKQEIGFGYECVYLPRTLAEPITMERYSYNEMPLCYTFLGMEALNQAGIFAIQNYPTLQLKGEGVMIGFIDSGIDYMNPIFRNEDGTTRIAGIWDQTVQSGNAPEGFCYGSAYTQEQINEALQSDQPQEVVPSIDEIGHGTYMASVACGGEDVSNQFLGAAPKATIGVVKLKPAKQYLKEFYFIREDANCFQENDIMLGMRYLHLLAEQKGLPLVYCLALGSNMGGHSGSTPFPSLIQQYANTINRIAVTGVGNEANQRHHFLGKIQQAGETQNVDIRVGADCIGFAMELWTNIPNVLSIAIVSPSGESTNMISLRGGMHTEFHFLLDRTTVFLDYRFATDRTTSELIALRFQEPTPGIWQLQVQGNQVSDGVFNIWLPVTEFLTSEVHFLESNPYTTITTPGEVEESITAAYYDGVNQSIGISSGRGFTRNNRIKPDFAAPGVNVLGVLPGNKFVSRTGSSAATGIAAGAVTLLMEWVIYQQMNPVATVQGLKSLLILGAQRKDGEEYPSREWGYGTLDLYNVFDRIRRF